MTMPAFRLTTLISGVLWCWADATNGFIYRMSFQDSESRDRWSGDWNSETQISTQIPINDGDCYALNCLVNLIHWYYFTWQYDYSGFWMPFTIIRYHFSNVSDSLETVAHLTFFSPPRHYFLRDNHKRRPWGLMAKILDHTLRWFRAANQYSGITRSYPSEPGPLAVQCCQWGNRLKTWRFSWSMHDHLGDRGDERLYTYQRTSSESTCSQHFLTSSLDWKMAALHL